MGATVTGVFAGMGATVTGVFAGMGATVTGVFAGMGATVTGVFAGMGATVTGVFAGMGATVTGAVGLPGRVTPLKEPTGTGPARTTSPHIKVKQKPHMEVAANKLNRFITPHTS
jgi:hypothetical protein